MANPCTLAQVRLAQNTIRDDPDITVWAGLAVLGYLTGWPVPVPRPRLASRLGGLDPQVMQCALSQAADTAVAARAAAIGARVRPGALAAPWTIFPSSCSPPPACSGRAKR